MQLKQESFSLEQQIKLSISPEMRQSLQVLSMSLQELRTYLFAQIGENPMLELKEPDDDPDAFLDSADLACELADPVASESEIAWSEREVDFYKSLPGEQGARAETPHQTVELYKLSKEETFTEHLLGQLSELDLGQKQDGLCRFLVECLDRRGYMSSPLENLAQETGESDFEIMQAMFVVQSLQPAGVGARNLAECLLLQLVEGPWFCAETIRLVKDGLDLIAKNDVAGTAKLLACSQKQALHYAGIIRSLNPIPSQGYNTGETDCHIVPDAVVLREGARLQVVLNLKDIPQITLSREYDQLPKSPEAEQAREYLLEWRIKALALQKAVDSRERTLQQVLDCLMRRQHSFFAADGALVPMNYADIAQELGVHVSTVSRAVSHKYMRVQNRTFPLKSLFTGAVPTLSGSQVSTQFIRQNIERFIRAEKSEAPLSDENIRRALLTMGVDISRRTVTKYRESMGFPGSHKRPRGE